MVVVNVTGNPLNRYSIIPTPTETRLVRVSSTLWKCLAAKTPLGSAVYQRWGMEYLLVWSSSHILYLLLLSSIILFIILYSIFYNLFKYY